MSGCWVNAGKTGLSPRNPSQCDLARGTHTDPAANANRGLSVPLGLRGGLGSKPSGIRERHFHPLGQNPNPPFCCQAPSPGATWLLRIGQRNARGDRTLEPGLQRGLLRRRPWFRTPLSQVLELFRGQALPKLHADAPESEGKAEGACARGERRGGKLMWGTLQRVGLLSGAGELSPVLPGPGGLLAVWTCTWPEAFLANS